MFRSILETGCAMSLALATLIIAASILTVLGMALSF